ncbi:MAG: energy transducer TonB [Gemmatimonadaceae bacterium]|nr:energy transducer TonB [Gemmatimonadaceae bacterium]
MKPRPTPRRLARSAAHLALAIGTVSAAAAVGGAQEAPTAPGRVRAAAPRLHADSGASGLVRVAQLLDTTALRAGLTALPRLEDPRPAARAFLIGVRANGETVPASLVGDGLMPDAVRDSLLALLRRAVRPAPPRSGDDAGWYTHLVLGTGAEAGWSTALLESAPARLLDPLHLQRRLGPLAQQFAREAGEAGAALRVRVRLAVSKEGLVESLTVLESSGRASVDEAVLAALKAERFAPATVDGIPVRSLVVQPVRLQVE